MRWQNTQLQVQWNVTQVAAGIISVTQLHVRCSGATLKWQNYSVTKILYAVQWSYIEVASLLSYSQLHVQVQWSYIEVDENGEVLSPYDELSNYEIEMAYQ